MTGKELGLVILELVVLGILLLGPCNKWTLALVIFLQIVFWGLLTYEEK